jgi:hypothetical protein
LDGAQRIFIGTRLVLEKASIRTMPWKLKGSWMNPQQRRAIGGADHGRIMDDLASIVRRWIARGFAEGEVG